MILEHVGLLVKLANRYTTKVLIAGNIDKDYYDNKQKKREVPSKDDSKIPSTYYTWFSLEYWNNSMIYVDFYTFILSSIYIV